MRLIACGLIFPACLWKSPCRFRITADGWNFSSAASFTHAAYPDRPVQPGSGPSVVDRVVQYLHVHMTDKITLDELSSVFFTSKSYLVKHFKLETGKTIVEYLNDIRIERAKLLLVTSGKSIEEISYSVGYESPKYFTRIFKSIVGMSPSAFTRQQKSLA